MQYIPVRRLHLSIKYKKKTYEVLEVVSNVSGSWSLLVMVINLRLNVVSMQQATISSPSRALIFIDKNAGTSQWNFARAPKKPISRVTGLEKIQVDSMVHNTDINSTSSSPLLFIFMFSWQDRGRPLLDNVHVCAFVLHINSWTLYPSTSSTPRVWDTQCPCRFFLLER